MNKEYLYTIFKDENEKYKIGLSKKNQAGEWEKAYFPVKFRKNVELENKTKIYIKDYWFDFYNWKHEEKKGTTFYFFISEFETVSETVEKAKEEVKQDNVFEEFGKQIEIDDSELPFE